VNAWCSIMMDGLCDCTHTQHAFVNMVIVDYKMAGVHVED